MSDLHDNSMDFVMPEIIESSEKMVSALHHDMSLNEHRSLQALAERMGISTVSTSYSGVDAPGTSIAMIAATLEHVFHVKAKHPKHLFAVEWEPSCRDELQHHPVQSECLFGDISDFLVPQMKRQMMELQCAEKLRTVFMPAVMQNITKAVRKFLDYLNYGKYVILGWDFQYIFFIL